jgi:hypothetical protein
VSPELYAVLESLAERTDESKSDVLRKAIVLMDITVRSSQAGNRLLIAGRQSMGNVVLRKSSACPPKPTPVGHDASGLQERVEHQVT